MSDSGTTEPPAQPPEEVPRRGRGRPRKLQQESAGPPTPKRPRGRPKGSKNKCPKIALKLEPMKERRPRGRPRKWLKKVVQAEVTKTQQVTSEEEEEEEESLSQSSSSQVPAQEEEQ